MNHPICNRLCCLLGLLAFPASAQELPAFVEQNGFVVIEAEQFTSQERDSIRRWYIQSSSSPDFFAETSDGDPNHSDSASGGAYIEVLPDTRRTHDDSLRAGENFSNEPGSLAVVHYPVRFTTPGRYYVWVRAFSTGTEDNGLHVGLDGEWPESGRRLQWCEGKEAWKWESLQRTEANHCGEPYRIYLDITQPGVHTVSFSMREDGFEFDRWLLTTDREFTRPEDAGPPASPNR